MFGKSNSGKQVMEKLRIARAVPDLFNVSPGVFFIFVRRTSVAPVLLNFLFSFQPHGRLLGWLQADSPWLPI